MTTNNDFCDKNEEKPNDYVKKSHNEQDLTEQYKKGELEQGWYYVKNEFGNIFISEYSKDYDFIGERVISGFFTEVSEITEIICEVPSYEQWQSLNELLDSMNDTNKALAHRLNICKELLKECREYVVNTPVYPQGDNIKQAEIHRLVDKINEVLK